MDFVELFGWCGGEALLNYFPFRPKNAQYTSSKYDSKFIEIINYHRENLLLVSHRSSCITFMNDKNKA